ncbi:MAG: ATP-dependent helicase HrpB, partial [Motiliproteus sp.]|nr:ATP-dependent helicase HrpB [Motiliproteus sp.]
LGQGPMGCDLAALLGEKDLLAATGPQRADISLRLEQLHSGSKSPLAHRVRETSKRWQRQLNIPSKAINSEQDKALIGVLLGFAFPDRIGQRRGPDSRTYRLRNGRGALFRSQDPLRREPYLVIADLDGKQADAQIYLAAEISLEQIRHYFSEQIEETTEVAWHGPSASVKARAKQQLGALTLNETMISDPDPELITAGLLAGIRSKGIDCLPWDKQSRALCDRVRLVNTYLDETDWPDLTDEALTDNLEAWLAPYLTGFSKLGQLKSLKLEDLLTNLLSWQQQQQLQEWLPSHFQVPSGSRVAIDYSSSDKPKLSVRIQELFGLEQSPRLLKGSLPLTIELLSPARRPIQITRDLISFWDNTYAEVCKDLKGRYPKHYWPDDPYQAQATRGTKKQMNRR